MRVAVCFEYKGDLPILLGQRMRIVTETGEVVDLTVMTITPAGKANGKDHAFITAADI